MKIIQLLLLVEVGWKESGVVIREFPLFTGGGSTIFAITTHQDFVDPHAKSNVRFRAPPPFDPENFGEISIIT